MNNNYSKADLESLESSRDIEGLCEALKNNDINIKKLSARALIKIADHRALEPLISTLDGVVDEALADDASTESMVCHYCVLALKKLASPKAINALIKASAKDKEGYFDIDVVQALVAIGASAIDPLIEVLNSQDERRRSTAAHILGEIGGNDASQALFNHICDEDPSVRNAVVFSLGEIGDERSVGPLTNIALNDSYKEIRENAKAALDKLGVKSLET